MNDLAKKEPAESIIEHTRKLLDVFSSIKINYQNVPKICKIDKFYEHLFYAITFHDIGKLASGFQEKWGSWGYRHEILSAGLIHLINEVDIYFKKSIMLAILTHHKDIDEIKTKYSTLNEYGKTNFIEKRNELLNSIDYINKYFVIIEEWSLSYLNIKIKPIKKIKNINQIKDTYKDTIVWFDKNIINDNFTPIQKEYGIFLRGFLIACDHLASSNTTNIRNNLRITEEIVNIKNLYPYQKKLFNIKHNVLLSAPTGSGKTEAALLWCANQRINRIFYILPYTASINAMFNRMVKIFTFEDVGIMHNKAEYYLFMFFMDSENSYELSREKAKIIFDMTKKIYKPLKISTPYQIIKPFFCPKGWELMISEMAGSAFVFDEIHIYDPRVIALILGCISFLKKINCKFLLLSATFPKFLKEKIKYILPDIDDFALNEKEPEDNFLINNVRHKVVLLDGFINDYIQLIENKVKEGKKVLVVCNTVKTSQDLYLRLNINNKILLHSKFMLKDREKIEKIIIANLPDLLISTQVIEVSLDLDFDTIFTEPAPIDALIQRFGRVNRKGTKGIADVLVFTKNSEFDKYIYNIDRIKSTISTLSNHNYISQKVINQIIEEVYKNGYTKDEEKKFSLTFSAFSDLINNLIPFKNNENENNYYDLIDSYQVIPSGEFEKKYSSLLKDGNYFEAMRYMLNISSLQFKSLLKKNLIHNKSIKIEKKIYSYYIIDVEYDDNLGLIIDNTKSKGVIIE